MREHEIAWEKESKNMTSKKKTPSNIMKKPKRIPEEYQNKFSEKMFKTAKGTPQEKCQGNTCRKKPCNWRNLEQFLLQFLRRSFTNLLRISFEHLKRLLQRFFGYFRRNYGISFLKFIWLIFGNPSENFLKNFFLEDFSNDIMEELLRKL